MAKQYEPFGGIWKKELMKIRKADLIDILRTQLLRIKKLEEEKEDLELEMKNIESLNNQ